MSNPPLLFYFTSLFSLFLRSPFQSGTFRNKLFVFCSLALAFFLFLTKIIRIVSPILSDFAIFQFPYFIYYFIKKIAVMANN